MRRKGYLECCLWREWAAAALSFALLATGWARAEDTVVIEAPSGRGTTTSHGEILDYTGTSLTLRRAGDRQEVIDSARVVKIETPLTASHHTGDEKFATREFGEALSHYQAALSEEQRLWVQRQLLAQIVWCFRATGRTEPAIDIFLQLVRSDPATPHYPAIPVTWLTEPLSSSLETKAQGLLSDGQPPEARLIAASWLLPTQHRGAAISALQSLLNAGDPRLAFLAETQLWRSQVGTVTPELLARWHERWRRMPTDLQSGPAYVLGQAYSRLAQPQEAALLFLRAPILSPRDRILASQALLAAGRELETMKQETEAATIYREIVAEHGASAAGPVARQRLAQLSQ